MGTICPPPLVAIGLTYLKILVKQRPCLPYHWLRPLLIAICYIILDLSSSLLNTWWKLQKVVNPSMFLHVLLHNFADNLKMSIFMGENVAIYSWVFEFDFFFYFEHRPTFNNLIHVLEYFWCSKIEISLEFRLYLSIFIE